MNKKYLYLLLLPGLLFQFIGAYFYFFNIFNPQTNQFIYTAVKLLLIAWPILYFVQYKDKQIQTIKRKKSIIIGALSGIFVIGIIYIFYILFLDYIQIFSPLILQKASDLNIINHYILFALFLSIIHSLIEEYYWRMFIFGGLTKITTLPLAYIISGIAFSAHHFLIISQFASTAPTIIATGVIAGAGMYWAWLYRTTHSIFGSWISHICADLIIMYIGYMLIF